MATTMIRNTGAAPEWGVVTATDPAGAALVWGVVTATALAWAAMAWAALALGGMMNMWGELSKEQRKQLQTLQTSMMPAMMEKGFLLREQAEEFGAAQHAFPIDQQDVKAKYEALTKTRQEMFSLRMGMMAQVQQIVGKEAWEAHNFDKKRGGPKK